MVIESCRQLQRGMGKMGQFLFVPEPFLFISKWFQIKSCILFCVYGIDVAKLYEIIVESCGN